MNFHLISHPYILWWWRRGFNTSCTHISWLCGWDIQWILIKQSLFFCSIRKKQKNFQKPIRQPPLPPPFQNGFPCNVYLVFSISKSTRALIWDSCVCMCLCCARISHQNLILEQFSLFFCFYFFSLHFIWIDVKWSH